MHKLHCYVISLKIRKCFGTYDTFEKKRVKLESAIEKAFDKLPLCGRKRPADSEELVSTPRVIRRIGNAPLSSQVASPPVMVQCE